MTYCSQRLLRLASQMSLLLWVHEGLGDRDTARRLAKGHSVTVLRLQEPGSITVIC